MYSPDSPWNQITQTVSQIHLISRRVNINICVQEKPTTVEFSAVSHWQAFAFSQSIQGQHHRRDTVSKRRQQNVRYLVFLFSQCGITVPLIWKVSISTVWLTTLENSSRDGNTRPPDPPPEKSMCRSRSNS